uniref:type VI secretion system lipoprotein TssJ n=1 Tax=Halomonas sp. TaxID=1486246 RepID=UPI002613108B|nr:type VI secretion system lipoprotein TssJ [Halomonas sp.]
MTSRRESSAFIRHRAWPLIVGGLVVTGLLSGCGVGGRIGNQMDGTVGDVLFGKNERVIVALDADEELNPDAEGNPLSVVVRIYQLDSLTAFNAASADELWRSGKDSLGESLLAERETVMLPGKQVTDSAPMNPDTKYVGVAAFFRQVPDQRWRLVFDAAEMRKDGILTSPDGVALHLANDYIEPADDDSLELLVADNDS